MPHHCLANLHNKPHLWRLSVGYWASQLNLRLSVSPCCCDPRVKSNASGNSTHKLDVNGDEEEEEEEELLPEGPEALKESSDSFFFPAHLAAAELA